MNKIDIIEQMFQAYFGASRVEEGVNEGQPVLLVFFAPFKEGEDEGVGVLFANADFENNTTELDRAKHHPMYTIDGMMMDYPKLERFQRP